MLRSHLKSWHYMLLQLVDAVNLFKIMYFRVFLLFSVNPSSSFSLIFLLPSCKTMTKVSRWPQCSKVSVTTVKYSSSTTSDFSFNDFMWLMNKLLFSASAWHAQANLSCHRFWGALPILAWFASSLLGKNQNNNPNYSCEKM